MTSLKPILSNLIVIDEGPKIPNRAEYKEILAAISTQMRPKRATFTLENVNTQFANLIRSTLLTGLPVRHLKIIKYENLSVKDPYRIHESIEDRVRLIPIKQDTEIGKIYKLNIKCDVGRDIKTTDFKPTLPCNKFTLLYLGDNCSVDLECQVVESIPRIDSCGVSLAYRVAATYESDNTVCLSNPTKFNISFSIHDGDAKEVILLAIKSIINRLESLLKLKFISNKGALPQYITYIKDEYEQMGHLLTRKLNEYNATANCDIPDDTVMCTLRIRTDENVEELFTKCVNELISQYTILLKI